MKKKTYLEKAKTQENLQIFTFYKLVDDFWNELLDMLASHLLLLVVNTHKYRYYILVARILIPESTRIECYSKTLKRMCLCCFLHSTSIPSTLFFTFTHHSVSSIFFFGSVFARYKNIYVFRVCTRSKCLWLLEQHSKIFLDIEIIILSTTFFHCVFIAS